ncbi:MAG: hypothetical protein N2B05_02095, partial [Gemmatimonadales bacterium]
MRARALAGAATLALLVTVPGELAAQDTGLSKSELVRVVVSPDPAAQKLETVGTRGISFEPTDG